MALTTRHFGMTTEELKLYCTGMSARQGRPWLDQWGKQPWPRRRPMSPRLRAFQEMLRRAQDAVDLGIGVAS